MTQDITQFDDIIDVRDVIERFEELEEQNPQQGDPDRAEFETLRELLSDLAGNGGDEQWRGDWYPIALIRDSYFRDYAQEFAEDTGAVNADARWPSNCIDWDRAARELQIDYTSVEFGGVTYWTR